MQFLTKAKSTIKRIAAISSGAAMVGATVFGAAAAADLSDWPGMFVQDGAWNALIVVGSGGSDPAGLASDVVGAIDIAAVVAQSSTTAAGTSTTVVGGKSEDVNIGDDITVDFGGDAATVLDDDDLAGLADSAINYDGNTYDYHEGIWLAADSPSIETSGTASDDEYGSNIGLELAKRSVGYYYLFDESVNLTGASEDIPIEISFLGKTLKITDIVDENSITAQVGDEYFLSVGDSVTVKDHTVSLANVASSGSNTIVTVDGTSYTVGSTAKTIGDIRVEVQNVFYSDALADRSATLLIGTDTTKTYDDGDAYIGEDETDPDWIWDLGELTTTTTKGDETDGSGGPTIGILNDFVRDDWEDNPVLPGECYNFPNDFAAICFDSLTTDEYVTLTMDLSDSIDVDDADAQGQTWGSSEDGLEITANVGETITLDESAGAWSDEYLSGDVATDTVYFIVADSDTTEGTVDVFYLDENNDPVFAGNLTATATGDWGFIDFKDTTGTSDIVLGVHGNLSAATGGPSAPAWYVTVQEASTTNLAGEGPINVSWSGSGTEINTMGDTASTEEADEVTYAGNNIGTKEYPVRTYYGMTIATPKTKGASDKFVVDIPADIVEATVTIKGPGTTVTESSTAVTVTSVAGVPLAKLDTEVTDKTSKPMVLVGGSCVNRLTAEALGLTYPTCGADSTVPENAAMIKLVENAFGGTNVAMIVAGWEAANTREATTVLKNYADYAATLTGTGVQVSGTTVTAITSGADVTA